MLGNVESSRNLNLNLLWTFLVIAEEKSISKAADRLLRGQPSVSVALKQLWRLPPEAPIEVEYYLVYRTNYLLSEAENLFLKALKQCIDASSINEA